MMKVISLLLFLERVVKFFLDLDRVAKSIFEFLKVLRKYLRKIVKSKLDVFSLTIELTIIDVFIATTLMAILYLSIVVLGYIQ